MAKKDSNFQEYIEAVKNEIYPNDSKMVDYIAKETARVVKLSNGKFIDIRKPTIQTSFCFGYSDCGQGSTYEEAEKMRAYAKTQESYFIRKNLEKFSWWYNTLLESPEDIYITNHYWKSPADTKIKSLERIDDWHWMCLRDDKKAEYEKVSRQDLDLIIQAYAEEINAFEKRLKTYLKRYGTKHLDCWTYWLDE